MYVTGVESPAKRKKESPAYFCNPGNFWAQNFELYCNNYRNSLQLL